MSAIAAIGIPQFATGPQKWVLKKRENPRRTTINKKKLRFLSKVEYRSDENL